MKKLLAATLVSIIFISGLGSAVRAADLNSAFSGDYLNTTAKGANYVNSAGGSRSVEEIVSIIITAALSLLGLIFLILIFYSGFLWMTAGGNEEKIKTATSIMKESIIGLLIVVGAYAISYFVLSVFVNNNKLG